MAATIPSIACLGVIGRNNNPLHTTIFPSHESPNNAPAPIRTPLQFSLLLASTIDIFDFRSRANTSSGTGLSGDLGLLHAVDDRLAAYGFETNTGVRFVVVVDMRGRSVHDVSVRGIASNLEGGAAAAAGGAGGSGARIPGAKVGLRDGDLKPIFRAMQTAYIRLLQNPFYDPDEQVPARGRPGKKIGSRRFARDICRIGENWVPGVVSL